MGLTNYTKAIPPRCKSCRHIEDDDPKRILTRSIDEFDQDVVAVTCPTLRCGIGWLSGYAYKHIVIEDEALISKELLKLLGCEEKDLIKGAPEKDTKPSGLELLAALLGPTYLHRQKMKDMDTYIDISNKKCNKDRVIIGRKLSDLINSKEDLWRKTGELARTIDYCLIEPFNERILAQLEVIEKEIGKSEEIDEVRDLVAALAQKEAMKPNRKVQTFRKLQE
ncbi:MAG: hypothetical protein KJ714_08740, partial [Euryarchaeota archaeon]|nr:hypothetical protein [Euryarchaeota archaeon]